MIAKASVKFKGDTLVFTDESTYSVPVKKVQLVISIPGYEDAFDTNIYPNQVNVINAKLFKLSTFPDGLYTLFFNLPDCPLEINVLNTWDLDECIDNKLKQLLSCANCRPDKKEKEKLDDALLLRELAKLADCNSLDSYQMARKLVCKDCN